MPSLECATLESLLASEGVSHLHAQVGSESLCDLLALLSANRVAFLSKLKDVGVRSLADRQRLANILSKSVKEGRCPRVDPIAHLVPCTWSQTPHLITVTLQMNRGTKSRDLSVRVDANEVLRKYYASIAQVLRKCYASTTQVLRKYCASTPQVLRKYYASTTQVLRKYCAVKSHTTH